MKTKKEHWKKAVEDWIKKQRKKLFIGNVGYISIGDFFRLGINIGGWFGDTYFRVLNFISTVIQKVEVTVLS